MMYKEISSEIQGLVTDYFEGIFYGDTKKLKACFHSNTHIYGDVKGDDYLKGIEEYLKGVENRQSPKELNEDFKMEIIGIDIMGKIAMVKLHVPMLGYNYYDYLSLCKINEEWKIVNKLFTHVE